MAEVDEIYGATTTMDEPAKRERQLVTAEMRLREEAERLLATSDELLKRLTPVLRPDEPTPDPNGAKLDTVNRDPSAAPLAAKLQETANRVNYASHRLEHILSRLEI